MSRCNQIWNQRTTKNNPASRNLHNFLCMQSSDFKSDCNQTYFRNNLYFPSRFKNVNSNKSKFSAHTSNQPLKILLIKMFQITLIFVFTLQYMKFWTKSLYMVGKILLAKKKTLLKFLKKKKLFSKSLLRGDGEGTFRLHFRNLPKIWW